MFAASEAFAAKISKSDLESLRGRLTAATCHFSQHLATQRRACLAQIWVPDAQPDGSVTLHTQVGGLTLSANLQIFRNLGMGIAADHSPAQPLFIRRTYVLSIVFLSCLICHSTARCVHCP